MHEITAPEEKYDVIIIGGGCAGLAAALYAKRYELKTLVIAKELGGLITQTHIVENYPGIKPMSGWDMMDIFLEQMKIFAVEMIEKEVVKVCQHDTHWFHVCTKDVCYDAKTVIYGTGTKHRELDAPGEKEYRNKGVSYCATCDGALFKGKRVGIVGGGDSAAKEALLLAEYAEHVYIFVRSKLRAEPINHTRIDASKKITVMLQYEIEEVLGDGTSMTGVRMTKEFEGSKELAIQGLFIAIGHLPQNELVKDLGLEMNKRGEVKIDRYSRTNIPGFYAAGDNTDAHWKQAIVSASEGAQAANSAYEDITSKRVQPI